MRLDDYILRKNSRNFELDETRSFYSMPTLRALQKIKPMLISNKSYDFFLTEISKAIDKFPEIGDLLPFAGEEFLEITIKKLPEDEKKRIIEELLKLAFSQGNINLIQFIETFISNDPISRAELEAEAAKNAGSRTYTNCSAEAAAAGTTVQIGGSTYKCVPTKDPYGRGVWIKI